MSDQRECKDGSCASLYREEHAARVAGLCLPLVMCGLSEPQQVGGGWDGDVLWKREELSTPITVKYSEYKMFSCEFLLSYTM